MNAQDAIQKIDSAGGSVANLSVGDFYDVYRALQGSFGNAALIEEMENYVGRNKQMFAEDEALQRRLISESGAPHTSLEEFRDKYRALTYFSSNESVGNKLDTQALGILKNYGAFPEYPEEDILTLGNISSELYRNVVNKDVDENLPESDKEAIEAKKNEIREINNRIQEAKSSFQNETGSSVLESSLQYIPTPEEIEKSMAAVDAISADITEEEDAAFELLKIFNIDSKTRDGEDKITNDEFIRDARGVIYDEVYNKLAINKEFANKTEEEKREIYLKELKSSTERFVQKTLLASVYEKVYDGHKTPKISEEQVTKNKEDVQKTIEAFINADSGQRAVKRVVISKAIATTALVKMGLRNKAVAKHVAEKTGVVSLLDNANKRINRLKEKYPKTFQYAESFGKAALKGGAVMAAGAFYSPAAPIVSAVFAAQSAVRAYKDLKKKYKNDVKYADKSFGNYLKDHKLDTVVVVATTAAAVIAGYVGASGLVNAVTPTQVLAEQAAERVRNRMMRGTGSLTVGLASGARSFVNANDAKGKKKAVGMMALSAGIASVSMFFGEDISKAVGSKLQSWFGDRVDSASGDGSSPAENDAENSAENNVENSAENDAENSAENDVENSAENDAENSAENDVGNSAENDAENSAENDVENSAENDAENSAENDVENSAENDAENSAENGAGLIHDATEASKAAGIKWDIDEGITKRTLSFRSMGTMWKGKLDDFYNAIESGQVESLPEGMSKEVYMHKLTQLMKLGPVVHKESIELALRDLKCEGTILTKEEIMQVHASLATIDKYGEYHGYEPTARTNNVTTSLEANVECETKNVNIKQEYIRGSKIERSAAAGITPVAEEKETSTTTVNNNTFIFNYTEETKEVIVEQREPIAVKEPVEVQEEIPMARAPAPVVNAPAEFNEIIESNQNFAQVATEKGWIFKDGEFQHVGTENAFSYMNEIAEKQHDFATKALRGGWGLELNDASFTSDEKLAGAYKAALEKGHVFVTNENGQLKTYMIKGGTFHTALYESNPEKYGESYNTAQQEITDFKARQAASAQTSSKQQPIIVNTGKGYGD